MDEITNNNQSIQIEGVPSQQEDGTPKITRVQVNNHSSVDSRTSIQQQFDDETIDTNNIVTPVRKLHGEVKQQTNSFDQVLAILMDLKENNVTKEDMKVQKREIIDEVQTELAEATKTVRVLGDENKKWMQQQNEKINEKSNCTRTSQGSSQNEREA